MKFLALSGSGRKSSTNTAMLRAVAEIARLKHDITVFDSLTNLPVFSPDFETDELPIEVQKFVDLIRDSDGVIIASPEYVRAIPGGLKNAIDWLVSRDEIMRKPIALMHASHRGDDMLVQLRLVLSTVSEHFAPDLFLRFEFMNLSPTEIEDRLKSSENQSSVTDFLDGFAKLCGP